MAGKSVEQHSSFGARNARLREQQAGPAAVLIDQAGDNRRHDLLASNDQRFTSAARQEFFIASACRLGIADTNGGPDLLDPLDERARMLLSFLFVGIQ